MIQRVRKSFIRITMTMLTLVLLVPLCALNIITSAMTYNQTQRLLEQIAQTEVYILDPPEPRLPEEWEPTENQNMGAVKPPQHTTTTTTEPVETTATSTVTTVVTKQPSAYENPEVPSNNRTTAPAPSETQPGITTRTEPLLPPEQSGIVTDIPPEYTFPTEPQQPEWTHPNQEETRPEPPVWTRPPREDFEDNNENEDDDDDADWRQGWQGMFASVGDFSLAQFLSLAGMTDRTDSAEGSAITTTTAPGSAAQTRVVSKKYLDFDRKREEPPMEKSNSIEHFVVYLNQAGTVTEVHGTDDYDTESCTQLISDVNSSKEYDGYCGSLQFVKKNYSQGAVVVFSDRQSDIVMLKNLLFASIGVFLLMEVIVFFLTRILTKRAMRPMQVSYEKQQQFISDAGHELKTPLTIISANADILADEIGENKWLVYIKSQAERMRILVQEMMDLMKISNNSQHLAQSHFNISSLIENVALPFECQAFEQQKKFDIELEPEAEFFGNTEQIRRMVGIFIDNAFKYSNENGTIQVQLKTENGKKVLKIYNTGIGIEKGEEEKIFERFYRSDSSRARQAETGGYGLGLAIAKSIADQHNIKIQVVTEPGQWISFNLTL
ncbi:MAG: hypothetical protein IJ512_00935 [Ruminococcus sp.]|nr:hypothetical protein [Ruminococcus sp.]